MTDPRVVDELEASIEQIAVVLFATRSVSETMQLIVDLAQESVDGCDAAGILLIDDAGVAANAVATGRPAVFLDELQIATEEGPCLDAARTRTSFYSADMADEVRWPLFAPEAVKAGFRSLVAYSLSGQRLSALNLYGRLPNAFGATDRAQGQLFATLARLAVDTAVERQEALDRAHNLREALRTRELIGQAQGILMERERITADQAFDVLRRASQHVNVKLRTIAVEVVETGLSPVTGPTERAV